jgi:hypothetical protein
VNVGSRSHSEWSGAANFARHPNEGKRQASTQCGHLADLLSGATCEASDHVLSAVVLLGHLQSHALYIARARYGRATT